MTPFVQAKPQYFTLLIKVALFVWLGMTLVSCAKIMVIQMPGAEKLPVQQRAVLTVPVAFEIVAMDDIPRSMPNRVRGDMNYELIPGVHELIFRYVAVWPNDEGEDIIVRSTYLLVRGEFKAGLHYIANWNSPVDLKTAMAFKQNPSFTLVGKEGSEKITSIALGAKRTLIDVLGLTLLKSEECAKNDNGLDDGRCQSRDSAALKQLKEAWNKANSAEREEFKKHIE